MKLPFALVVSLWSTAIACNGGQSKGPSGTTVVENSKRSAAAGPGTVATLPPADDPTFVNGNGVVKWLLIPICEIVANRELHCTFMLEQPATATGEPSREKPLTGTQFDIKEMRLGTSESTTQSTPTLVMSSGWEITAGANTNYQTELRLPLGSTANITCVWFLGKLEKNGILFFAHQARETEYTVHLQPSCNLTAR